MEVMPGVFDGENLILRNRELVPLSEISRSRLELKPYLLFPVEVVGDDGENEEIRMGILYPHTVDRELGTNKLVYGEVRQTRIYHFLDEGSSEIQRKPDLRKPHHVTTLGYRQLIIEMKDGTEIEVAIDGNCRYLAQGVTKLHNGPNLDDLEELFDRPSEFANIIKKAGLEVYAN